MRNLKESGPVTHDTLFSGKMRCTQYRNGYRYSVDAVLLAHFISPTANESILDLGAGCGIISLILAYRWPHVSLTSLEIQAPLLSLIHHNRDVNHLQSRLDVVSADLRAIRTVVVAGSFDWVVCNPPYRKSGSGRVNPVQEQAVARHEIKGTVQDCVKAAAYVLKNSGRAAFVYPASRTVSLLSSMEKVGLAPKRMQIVYGYPGAPGRLILVEAIKNGGEELQVLSPFYIYKERGGQYTEEMAKLYSG